MGIRRHRARSRRRAFGLAGALIAVAAAAAVLAAPAEAASEATFDDLVDGSHATVNGNLGSFTAGLMGMTIDGASGAAGYCIDIGTTIEPGESGLGEVDWETSGVPDLDTVGRILAAYHPNGSGPAGYEITGTDAQRAAATQAAIWHVTDGFELTVGDNDPVIEANYAAILAAVDADALPSSGQPDVSLSIASPDVTSGEAGTPVGPFVVSTTASAVTLTPGAGVSVTDGEGVPLAGPIVDGTEFFLLSDVDATATVTASAEATVHAGRAFVKDGSQRLILATSVATTVDAEASATWTAPPTTAPPTTAPPTTAPPTTAPPTTAPPESTTTVPEPTSTTVTPPQQTSTTLSIQPNPSVIGTPAPAPSTPTPVPTSGSLPRTGNDARPLVAVGLVLVAAGAMLGVAARHRRT